MIATPSSSTPTFIEELCEVNFFKCPVIATLSAQIRTLLHEVLSRRFRRFLVGAFASVPSLSEEKAPNVD